MEDNDEYTRFLSSFITDKQENKADDGLSKRNNCGEIYYNNTGSINFKTINTNHINSSIKKTDQGIKDFDKERKQSIISFRDKTFPVNIGKDNKETAEYTNTNCYKILASKGGKIERWTKLYNLHKTIKNKKKTLKDFLKSEEDEEYYLKCTFKPLINRSKDLGKLLKKSLLSTSNVPISNSDFDAFINVSHLGLNSNNINKKNNKSKKLKDVLYEQEVKECSFSPCILKKSKSLNYNTGDCLVCVDSYNKYIKSQRDFIRDKNKIKKENESKPGYGVKWKQGITTINEFNLVTNIRNKHSLDFNIESFNKPLMPLKYKNLENTKENLELTTSASNTKDKFSYTKLKDLRFAEQYLHNAIEYLDI